MIISTTSTGEQRRFTIERLRERPHSTNELRQMGIYYPPSRIKELRNQGYLIDTFYREETDSTGLTHRVNTIRNQLKSSLFLACITILSLIQ
ncbi:helix-turn-helix domain-containing protein [Aggregatibacter actinomycetemcomitans]|uniref:helix-turn-helix domain-containing protein n=1 Tax=Aggregatibacter actinomycetemcomitans TaxID=714 RepID=UPI001E5005F8|nr:helix-turn-helix domain-containing protein [Aggregatibacter actinomycetemcomitans]